jgi:FkbM family methyltransferase
MSPNELLNEKDEIIFAVLSQYYHEIKQSLIEKGFSADSIFRLYSKTFYESFDVTDLYKEHQEELLQIYKALDDEESRLVFTKRLEWLSEDPDKFDWKECSRPMNACYFDCLPLSKSEDVIDCGAFDGDTLRAYLENVGDFNTYTAFELNSENYESLSECIKNNEKINNKAFVIAKGVSDICGECFFDGNDVGVHISESGNKAELTTIDNEFADKNVTLIKMDIEGAELAALKGAKSVILRDRPKLAICAYHKFEDLWELPLFILNLNAGYKIKFRHYSLINDESIIYAYC